MGAALLAIVLLADPPALDAQRAAVIERDQQKAQAAVDERFGNKKPSELSSDERRDKIKAQAEAEQKVLDQHGVDARTWARYSVTRGRADYAEQQQRVKALAQEEADAKAKEGHKQPGEISVQRGFSEANPVVLEEQEGAKPDVEKGLPLDVREDEQAAKDADESEKKTGGGDKPAHPAKAEKKPAKRR